MTVKISFDNPISKEKDYIELKYPIVDYNYWKWTKPYNNNGDLIKILDDILIACDCTKVIECGRICTINSPIYKRHLSEYYYYLTKIEGYKLFDEYIDKLIQRHIKNIEFDYSYNDNTNKVKIKRHKLSNKYIRNTFIDMFSNTTKYLYNNPVTNDEIISDDANLLDVLNKKKIKKEKKVKEVGVPISNMTFNFKKNK